MTEYTKADFTSDQEVRWCPGCGDYAILASMQRLMPELGIPRENIVFVSGIGCAGRFPYYMNTYGFHTIHGRAPAVATGLKISRPELSVWVVTGDGDGLSIGANHLMHMLRRNLDINVLLFNNKIYGLTKGQYSPTSEQGKRTNTSPDGAIDIPLDPIQLALASNASFVARVLDVDAKGLQQVIKEAAKHKGSAFIEIYQNCNIFNDAAFAHFGDRKVRPERTLWLEDGKPLVFGEKKDKGIVMDGFRPMVSTAEAALVHDVSDRTLAGILAGMDYPDFPVPMGIFRAVEKATYEDILHEHANEKIAKEGTGDLSTLLRQGYTWDIYSQD